MLRSSTDSSPLRSPSRQTSSSSFIVPGSPILMPLSMPVDWTLLTKTVNEIGQFLASIDRDIIGTGLMLFNQDGFCLEPRSSVWNNHSIQKVINRGNKNASLEGVKKGFTLLIEKINILKTAIDGFVPERPEDCSEEFRELSLKLIELESIIARTSKKGLEQLCGNYRSTAKEKAAGELRSLGKKSFKDLCNIETGLLKKIIRYHPEFEKNEILHKYHSDANKIIGYRYAYCEELRKTRWSPEMGVIVSDLFVGGCIVDFFGTQPKRMALCNAANAIKLPRSAVSIPIHRFPTAWVPALSETNSEGQIEFNSGVFGTCEREGNSSEGVCNIYYIFYQHVKQLLIGCGTINTREKARQILALLLRDLKDCAKTRVVIHQLNSLFNESNLIVGVHEQSVFLEEELNKFISDHPVKVLHFNTAFNAATKFPHEDSGSLKKINICSLPQLIQFVLEDLHSLVFESITVPDENVDFLQDDSTETPDHIRNELNSISLEEGNAVACQSAEPPLKLPKGPLVFDLLVKLSDKSIAALNLVGGIRMCKQTLSNTSPAVESSSGISESSSSSSDLFDQFVELRAEQPSPTLSSSSQESTSRDQLLDVPTPLREITKLLKIKQQQLTVLLQDIALTTIPELIMFFQLRSEGSNRAPISRKIILILSLIKEILSVQLKVSDSPLLSRCSEIELFLLLYRLTNINPIITCWSGLDRSGCVRAMADSQIELEQSIFERMMGENSAQDESLAKIKASEEIFRMIMEFDPNRDELYRLTMGVLADNQVVPAVDEKTFKEFNPIEKNFKDLLFQAIDQKDLPLSQKQLLKNTQHYLELVYRHLIGTETEKTVFSTGVPGLKYNHSLSKFYFDPRQIGANPHPLERMPFVIRTESGKWIQILSRSWMSPFSFTPLGLWMTEHLSQLRGS